MKDRLIGRTAVVTGGGGGLGQAIAERLAADGADVAVADIIPTLDTQRLVEAKGRRFLGLKCDVSDPAQVNAFARQTRERLGRADIVVNNAVFAEVISFDDLTFETWQRFLAVNVSGYFLVVKEFLEDLKSSVGGRVINMSSTSFWESPPSFVGYASAKGAVNGFTNALATDLGGHNITVNAIAPSLIRTPATLRLVDDKFFAWHMTLQSLKREQTPQDVANMVAFLASDEGAFITGQVIAVDGGLTRR